MFAKRKVIYDTQHFIDIAKNCAMKSNMSHKHGCVIVYRNTVLSSGYNYYINFANKYSVHAELDAIHKVKNKYKVLPHCELYVVRISNLSNNTELKCSKPCEMCSNIIKKYNIKEVYYSM